MKVMSRKVILGEKRTDWVDPVVIHSIHYTKDLGVSTVVYMNAHRNSNGDLEEASHETRTFQGSGGADAYHKALDWCDDHFGGYESLGKGGEWYDFHD